MARRGEVLEGPINAQRAVFRETVGETDGGLLRLDFYVARGGFLGNEHLRPKQDERIEVLRAHSAAAPAAGSGTWLRGRP